MNIAISSDETVQVIQDLREQLLGQVGMDQMLFCLTGPAVLANLQQFNLLPVYCME